MEELGYENFNEDVINTELTDSYLWAARLRNVKKQTNAQAEHGIPA
jgi:hypothetical protein